MVVMFFYCCFYDLDLIMGKKMKIYDVILCAMVIWLMNNINAQCANYAEIIIINLINIFTLLMVNKIFNKAAAMPNDQLSIKKQYNL